MKFIPLAFGVFGCLSLLTCFQKYLKGETVELWLMISLQWMALAYLSEILHAVGKG